jgi:hypothetical protein
MAQIGFYDFDRRGRHCVCGGKPVHKTGGDFLCPECWRKDIESEGRRLGFLG